MQKRWLMEEEKVIREEVRLFLEEQTNRYVFKRGTNNFKVLYARLFEEGLSKDEIKERLLAEADRKKKSFTDDIWEMWKTCKPHIDATVQECWSDMHALSDAALGLTILGLFMYRWIDENFGDEEGDEGELALTTNTEKKITIIDELKPLFNGDLQIVRAFLNRTNGKDGKAVTDVVGEYIKEKKIFPSQASTPLFSVLKKYNRYRKTQQNWLGQINKFKSSK